MRLFLYALFIVAFGAFVVGCADLDYVDDYSDSTFYDEEYADDEAEDENQYAQEEADEEVVAIASALSAKNSESKQVKNINTGEKTTPKEPQRVAQPAPKSAPQPTPQPTPKQTSQPAPAPAPQATAEADSQGITKIDDSTFEYNGMVFKHNLGKDADLNAILAVLNKGQSQTPKAEPKSIDSPKVARDSRPAIVSSVPSAKTANINKANANSQKIRGKGFKGLTQSTAKLKAQCENNGNIQKCEDLGRIYALRGDLESAIIYYKRACDNGNGSALSCFFLSQIYANDGDSAMAQGYTDMLGGRVAKVGSIELRLSTGKVTSVKRSLKMSCTKGDEGSCNTLQSIFKMRGETSEMKTYFGTECWRGSTLGCNILRSI